MRVETVRVFLMTGGHVDIRCCGFDDSGSQVLFLGPVPIDKATPIDTWAKFQRAAIAGYVVLDTQAVG